MIASQLKKGFIMRNRSFDEIEKNEIIPGAASLTAADIRLLSVADCNETRELIARWPSLAESERMRLAPHLERCESCRARALEAEKITPLFGADE